MLGMRCVVLYCDWYDSTLGGGYRVDEFGVTLIHSRRHQQKYDPFILVSQRDQVMGQIHAIQSDGNVVQGVEIPQTMSSCDVEDMIDLTVDGDEMLDSGSDEEIGEFDKDSDSVSSANSSNFE